MTMKPKFNNPKKIKNPDIMEVFNSAKNTSFIELEEGSDEYNSKENRKKLRDSEDKEEEDNNVENPSFLPEAKSEYLYSQTYR